MLIKSPSYRMDFENSLFGQVGAEIEYQLSYDSGIFNSNNSFSLFSALYAIHFDMQYRRV